MDEATFKRLLPRASKAVIDLNRDNDMSTSNRCPKRFRAWTVNEEAKLRLAYGNGNYQIFSIENIAQELGRSVHSITTKADELGICNPNRPKSTKHNQALSKVRKGKVTWNKGKKIWQNRPHPRGMAGKHHSSKARAAISLKQKGKKQSPEFVIKRLKASAKANGSLCRPRKHGSWKAGWRTIGGQRIYARSRWEANYARYLELLKQAGEIEQWEHEPETFWFDKIKRGVRSYLPDFRVTDNIGSIEYHEVKGWNDARSQTKAKRMKKYFPEVIVKLIDGKWFSANRIKLSGIIPDWEK